MARLEFIDFKPWKSSLSSTGELVWEPDHKRKSVDALPQLYLSNGHSWDEANLWSLERAVYHRAKPETLLSLMRHLQAYAQFLENEGLDWRHFPMRLDERAIVKFRGDLIQQIQNGNLAASTAGVRMNAVIQFYRFAEAHDLVDRDIPMWSEKTVNIPFFDNMGFKRAMSRVATDLKIHARSRLGVRLEDGLLPLSTQAMTELLTFVSKRNNLELHLMLNIGFFTGARIGTIISLRRENLANARPDPLTEGFFLIRVGPGTNVHTKNDVQGDLMVPAFLLNDLKEYAESVERLRREAKANSKNKTILFLSRRSNPYTVNSVDRLVQELRKRALADGLNFMKDFKFHQTRATYGTWLMQIMLDITTPSVAIEFVRRAMFHLNEATTFLYIKFLEHTKGKEEVAAAFNTVFTGLKNRNWDTQDA